MTAGSISEAAPRRQRKRTDAAMQDNPARQPGVRNPASSAELPRPNRNKRRGNVMGRYLLLWLLGIPIPLLLLIWLFGGLN